MINLLRQVFGALYQRTKVKSASTCEGVCATLPRRSVPTLNRLASFFFPAFWDISEPEKFAEIVKDFTKQLPHGYHASDNFITWGRNNSMFDDLAFIKAWEDNIESLADRGIIWCRYVLATSAFHCIQLEGDFVKSGA